MVDRDVLLSKMTSIHRCLRRIDQITKGNPDSLDDLLPQDAFVLNLQRAIQLAIDMGSHVIAAQKLGMAQSLKEVFLILRDERLIPAEVAGKMGKMVGFRNIAVHDYNAIDPNILRAILADHLGDIEEFVSALMSNFPE